MNLKLKTKDYIFLLVVLVGIVFLVIQKTKGKKNDVPVDNSAKIVSIGDNTLFVDVSASEEARKKGLRGVEKIEKDSGMLFVHEGVGRFGYNMHGLTFDLDFIFIRNEEVVDVAKSVSRRYNGVIEGDTEYDSVIEVNADWVRKNGVIIGDKVDFTK